MWTHKGASRACAESGGPCEDTAICPGEGPQGSQVCQPFDPGLSDSRTTLLKLPSLWHSNSTSQLYTPSNYVPVLLELLMRVLEEVGVMTQQSQPGSQAKISLPFCLSLSISLFLFVPHLSLLSRLEAQGSDKKAPSSL